MNGARLGYATILRFYRKEAEGPATFIFIMATVSGVANGALLGLINYAAEVASDDAKDMTFRLFLLFAIAFVTFIYSKKHALLAATREVESIIRKVRKRVSAKIMRAELAPIDGIGRPEIYTRLSQETNLISEAAFIIVNAGQSAMMLVACFIYIAYLSMTAFLITFASIAVGVSMYLFYSRDLNVDLWEATRKETAFFTLLGHALDGFKEHKLHRRRSEEINDGLATIADETAALKLGVNTKMVVGFMFSQIFFYALLGVIVFVLPAVSESQSVEVLKLSAAILFIIGPLTIIVGSIQLFVKTAISIDHLYELETMLDEAVDSQPVDYDRAPTPSPDWKTITLEGAAYTYPEADGFSLKPVDLTIERGKILFLVGGNGSGKSTLLKVLTGLYFPTGGHIAVDGEILDHAHYPDLRELFTGIFGDFHLFDRLYGLGDIDPKRVNALLKEMGLEKKTVFKEGRFTKTDLSTGQKKRLAMVVAKLEERPIYILDEWAAEQDPEFREYFYETMLDEMKKEGKTIIAVSHDDRYFKRADTVVKLESGRIVDIFDPKQDNAV